MNSRNELVRNTVWARELADEEVERALRGVSEKHYAKGSYLCHRGDRYDYWTGIVTGLIKMSSIARSGKAITFAGIGAGGWFGEGSVLKDEPRKYDLVALRDTHLLMMSRSTFFWLYENSVGFNRFLVRQLNERLAQFIASTEYERILDPKARVARNLAWLCNPVLNPDVKELIEITQEELALLAGVSRPVANRSLQALEEEGLLRVEHGRIIVADVERLGDYGARSGFE
ncbi:Crp/Fnr family transcriptional regulator [Pseudaminobacter arsenicus]|uniref:Crp/Fnr family transcriptional regulator n=1 Tax=Borborobacter arsenicus TaxID=1851146 RepID=A0A432V5J6_9HYPH|nr:Crp/Fnr family transcriptional regulator [Pseudaminobacter arsenicus]RUM97431.1 Crp/Fnr family transcriptional regulator [Pseudaminobacter arsenicus]